MNRDCELYDRECIDCGECDICDMDESKICDNCGRCLDVSNNYRTLKLDEFMKTQSEKKKEGI